VNTRVILDTREHGPSRPAGVIVNDVMIIFYLQDGCPKWHPCSRAVFTAHGSWTRPVNTGSMYRCSSCAAPQSWTAKQPSSFWRLRV